MFSPRQRLLPNNTQPSQETDINALHGIRTCNPSKRAAAYPRLRPRGYRNRRQQAYNVCNYQNMLYHILLCVVVDVAAGGASVASSEFPWVQVFCFNGHVDMTHTAFSIQCVLLRFSEREFPPCIMHRILCLTLRRLMSYIYIWSTHS